ncbi:uncharacterized protein TNCV_3857311 [Trichonephila clavipes]|nr:uncharacterized protein TNCV_3857311 [Trichonephila clavipes]
MYIQDRFGSYRSIEWTKTDWNCTRYSIITCFAQTSDSLARLTQTLARMPDVMDMRERNIKVSLLRVYQALILSRLDYGCVVYGSARASLLRRLDMIHHSALRIISLSGAFRTSPVTSLYVVCHQPPLELRRMQLSANYFIRAMSVPSHPLKPFSLAIGLTRLYDARSFNIKPFSERAEKKF